jgi:hypothetical protein
MFFAIKKPRKKTVLVTDNEPSLPNEKELNHAEVKVIFLPRTAPHCVWTKGSV